jgi:hypothetical protein
MGIDHVETGKDMVSKARRGIGGRRETRVKNGKEADGLRTGAGPATGMDSIAE